MRTRKRHSSVGTPARDARELALESAVVQLRTETGRRERAENVVSAMGDLVRAFASWRESVLK